MPEKAKRKHRKGTNPVTETIALYGDKIQAFLQSIYA
jgi:hypothetical protein